MSEKTAPNIQQTMIENVLIKHQALSTNQYAQAVIKQAQQKASDCHQQAQLAQLAQLAQEAIHAIAYQQGYQDGLAQLLHDFIDAIETSEKEYQKTINQTETHLVNLLTSLFSDERLQQIVAEHFTLSYHHGSNARLHIPAKLQEKIPNNMVGLTVIPASDNTIAFEIDNKITYFSPKIATKKTLPQIFAISTRCQIHQQHKQAYNNLIKQLQVMENHNED
ncbi:hypothetical protein [Providencia rustigianii]|uniref:hypothetical protein n=1 Tax=Providencia rustigianii TaxID=158850 RepID=UPI0038B33CF7